MDQRGKVYLETSFISYLTARPSLDPVRAARQDASREWWARRRTYSLGTSQLVVDEAHRGHPEAAARRLAVLGEAELLDLRPEAGLLALEILYGTRLPASAHIDALHIAVAAIYGLDFLLTWDQVHIANPTLRSKIEGIVGANGYEPPFLCTPIDLLAEV